MFFQLTSEPSPQKGASCDNEAESPASSIAACNSSDDDSTVILSVQDALPDLNVDTPSTSKTADDAESVKTKASATKKRKPAKQLLSQEHLSKVNIE